MFGERYRWLAWTLTYCLPPIVHSVRTRSIPSEFKLTISSNDRGFFLPIGGSILLLPIGMIWGAGAALIAIAIVITLLWVFRSFIDWQGFNYGGRATIFMYALLFLPLILSTKFQLSFSQTIFCFWLIAFSFGTLLFAPLLATHNPPPCPRCGQLLRTSRSKQCWYCKADWH